MFEIVSFYSFVNLSQLESIQADLKGECDRNNIRGTILLATEGINGGLCGSSDSIKQIKKYFQTIPELKGLVYKTSYHDVSPFRRMLVKIKKEIVSLRRGDLDTQNNTGKYLSPLDFQDLMEQDNKDFVLVDTRNDYEFSMGSFEGAVNPNISKFAEFPEWLDANLSSNKDKKIITFCTGGIRCEKATVFMKNQGYSDVYQLEGGILSYLEFMKSSSRESKWQGECTVFDKRLALKGDLEASSRKICFVCLQSISLSDETATYSAGVACSKCNLHMKKHQKIRSEKALSRRQENARKRRENCKKNRSKYMSSLNEE